MAVDKYSEGEELEQIQLAVLSAQMKNKLTTESLNIELQKILNNDKEVTEYSDYFFYKTNKSYRIYKDGKVEEGTLLPDEFQQVEYIESTGTQYIDTKYRPNGNTRIEIDFSLPSQSSVDHYTSQQSIFGARNNNNINSRFTLFSGNGINRLQGDFAGDSNLASAILSIPELNLTTRNYITMSNSLIINKKIYNTIEKKEFINDYNMFIFANNKNGNTQLCSKMILYLFKIYDNETLMNNFIPCKCTTNVIDVNGKQCSSGTIGLYDTVEGKFYTNQGDGDDFIAGPEV